MTALKRAVPGVELVFVGDDGESLTASATIDWQPDGHTPTPTGECWWCGEHRPLRRLAQFDSIGWTCRPCHTGNGAP